MGQLTDLHTRIVNLLGEIKTAAGGDLRIYETGEPVQLPEMPCVYDLTPDEEYENVDTVNGRSIATATVRLCVDARRPLTDLLALADVVIETADVWLRSEHPAPIDQARRTSMRRSTPTFDGVATRGADFQVRVELEFRQTTPAP